MPGHDVPENVKTQSAEEIAQAVNGNKDQGLSLESLILLINTERLQYLQDTTNKELQELKERQDKVSFLQKLIKKINIKTAENGELDYSSDNELKEMLAKAKEMGVDMKNEQKLTKNDKERLIDNIRMTMDDYNVKNDMQLQTVNRLTTERYESFQLARSIIKPLHDAKVRMTQGMAK